MGVFSTDKRKITCIYNSNNATDTQTLAYLKASKKDVLPIDLTKQTLTGTQWVELAEKLSVSLKTLVNDTKVDIDITNFDDNDCITILRENPEVLNGAIVFTTSQAMQIQNASKAQEFIDKDTGALPKPYNK